MKKSFVKICAVLLTASLTFGLTACESRESPTASTQQTEETSTEKKEQPSSEESVKEPSSTQEDKKQSSETSEKPEKTADSAAEDELKYPQFIPSEIKDSPIFKELCKKDNAVFVSEHEVITAPTRFEQFWQAVEAGKAADLYVYTLDLPFGSFDNQIFCSHYIFDGKDFTQEESYAQGKDLYTNPASKIQWSDVNVYPVKLRLASKGGVMVENDYEPMYLQLVNDRDIFPNFEEGQKVYEKYLEPLYLALATDNTFQSVADIKNLPELINGIISFETDGKEDYWSVYPDAKCPLDDAFSYLSRYFDLTKEELTEACRKFTQDDAIFYEGGLGGAYPTILVKDTEEEGDISRITLCTRSVIDDSFGKDRIVTMKHLPDGTFHYVSFL